MKKTVMIAIVLCMLMGLVSSAAAATDEEILFRGIPWETDIVTFSNAVKDEMTAKGISDAFIVMNDTDSSSMFRGYTGKGQVMIDWYTPAVKCYYCDVLTVTSGFPVAGLDAGIISIYSVPEMENASPLKGNEHTDVVFAMYDISLKKFSEKDEIKDQLKEKLSEKYGEPNKEKRTFTLWKGANDTFCCLYAYSKDSIILGYGKTDLPERMEALMGKAEDTVDSYEGL